MTSDARAASAIRFQPMAAAEEYPAPRAPMLPVAGFGMVAGGGPAVESPFLGRGGLFLPSGRAALALALKRSGVEAGDRVLMPAFHCGSLVEPALSLDAEVVLFRLRPDLSPDLDDLRRKLPGARALVVAHYFGFPQPLEEVARLCDAAGVMLIEDCAHAFFGAVGRTGAFAIASTKKFFPGVDGGMIVQRSGPLDGSALRRPGARAQLKSLVNTVENAGRYGRLFPFGRLVHALLNRKKGPPAVAAAGTGPVPRLRWFREAEVGLRGTAASRLFMRISAKRSAARKRRANFRYLLDRLAGLARAKPLYDALPGGVVPYVFPLLLDDPEKDFDRLKRQGVPIWRWEELAESECAVSQDYRLRLLQLPCHQALTARELDWIAGTIEEVLSS